MNGFESFMNRGSGARIAELIKKSNEKRNYDEGCWKIECDKETGTATAVIRFLPSKSGNDLPYQQYYSHIFKGDDGRWCSVERCPHSVSFDNKCPICDLNAELWKTGNQANEEKARLRKAKKTYVFQIYIVKDPQNPANEGKVMIYKCGPSIFKMVMDSMSSQFGEEPKNPFDVYEGHNFHVRVRQDPLKRGFPQYDKSSFDNNATALATNPEDFSAIYEQMIDLKDYVEKIRIPSLEELEKKAAAAYCTTFPKDTFAMASEAPSHVAKEAVAPVIRSEAPSALSAMDELPFDTTPSVAPSEAGSLSDDAFWQSFANKI